MQSVVIHAPNDLRLDDRANAPAPQPGEVRVAISRGGICGSDLHYFHHGGFGATRIKEPMILGHEVSGIVDAVGQGVDGFAAGDRVTVNPSIPCGRCQYCLRDMRNQCEDMRFAGSAMRFPHQQGLFRQGVTVDAAQLVRLSPTTDLSHAAMAEPLAVCLHAVRRAGPLLGKRVLVSGCGPIGCLTVLAAKHVGATEVIATDLGAAPLDIAARIGADRTIDIASAPDQVEALTEGKGTVDVAFDCSGSEAALQTAIRAVRPAGTVVAVGLGPDAALPLSAMVTREITLTGTFRFDSEFGLAAHLIDRGAVDVSPLLTQVMPLREAASAFALASDRSRAMKVQLDFDGG
ncbi:L-idonate 5-dehydrogenase [Tranquillimonas rosea]|uniref:L-idonate 5-dehydrogenase n=1 Tax=Tranquillimonas rosea TaxID=641238 RepID=UPI003BA90647